MPALYRRNPDSPETLIPCTVSELDWNRRVLLVFPGREACREDDKNPAEQLLPVIKLAERMLQYNPADPKHAEQVQVVVAGWEPYESCRENYLSLHERPFHFSSGDAKEFMASLDKAGFNTARTSILGWSYGSTFLQQCANAGCENNIAFDQVQALMLGTALTPEMIHHGFSGGYVFGTNDQTIAHYLPQVSEHINQLVGGRLDKLTIMPCSEHTMLVTAPIPTHPLRRFGGMPAFKNEQERERDADPTAHRASSYAEATFGSTARMRDEDETKNIPAFQHTTVVVRSLNNLLGREALLTPTQMVQDTPYLLEPNPPFDPAHSNTNPNNQIIAEALHAGSRVTKETP